MPPLMFAVQVEGEWRPGIGDPTFMGWLTVIAYLTAAVACGAAARAERRRGPESQVAHPVFWRFPEHPAASSKGPRSPSRRALFWWMLAAGLLVLGINKQLDLQTFITVFGRRVAHEQGWYEDRQEVQRAFIVGVAALGVVLLAALTVMFRSVVRRSPLATIGLVFLYVFVMVRASSFHNVDLIIDETIVGLRVNWILELGGILCVLCSAIRRGGDRFGRD